jgi:hypothetical protein
MFDPNLVLNVRFFRTEGVYEKICLEKHFIKVYIYHYFINIFIIIRC